MSDIRDGHGTVDPYREPLTDPGVLRPAKPAGSELTLHDDGTVTFDLGEDNEQEESGHFDNLAETMDETDLSRLATDLLDSIEVDKEARKRRDSQYTEGLRRTGLGDDAPGGAPFNGASRAVHPMLLEATVDFSARIISEMLPPEGPCKPLVIGEPTNEKTDRGERISRHMNYQFTDLMASAYSELEQGFTQEGLAGAFYVKPVVVDAHPDLEVVHMDMVHRPWTDGSFYVQQRITHEMPTDKWTFEDNVTSGIWRDVVDARTSTDNIEQTNASRANDRIIGRDAPTENIDDVRTVYEISTRISLQDGDPVEPYLVTIDEQTRRILAIYRNYEEDDPNKQRLDFLVEFPFLPWRGGYPIGLAHMIGSLSGAASGSLRALLDAALLATMQTGVKLKGGATAGGQNIRPQPGSTTEVQGSLVNDDIRKTYMPLEFPQPSSVLFQLLGFLVDSGRGVVRTTFDEFSKMNGEMPVGTANMMIEQGLKTFGSVFGRQHRAMRRLLRMLWKINQRTVVNEQIVDQFGELLVTKEDYAGPMTVQPVSDPRIFSDTQRQAQGQLVATRAQTSPPGLYKARNAELFMLRSMKVPEPEQFLVDAPEPKQINAAAENVSASQGLPIKAFPGQDHEAHIAQHGAYMSSDLFGSNPVIAMKFLPIMLQHFAEHIALWYADAMLLATNGVLRETFKDPQITLEALQTVKGLEAQLDQLMAELTPDVMQHADQTLGPAKDILMKAQALMKQMAPPTPMDPSAVAMKDVERQAEADKANTQVKALTVKQTGERDQQKLQLAAQKQQQDAAAEQQKDQVAAAAEQQRLQAQQEADEKKHLVAAANAQVASERNDVARDVAAGGNETQARIAEEKNATALEIASDKNETAVEVASKRPKPAS